jgi:anti-anti-sigma regulatory factor
VDSVLYADKQLEIRASPPAALKLAGEIDAWNVESVFNALTTTLSNGDVDLDLAGLAFCDVDGIRALAKLAEKMRPDQRLIVRGMPRQLRTVLELVGWAELPKWTFEDSGVAS